MHETDLMELKKRKTLITKYMQYIPRILFTINALSWFITAALRTNMD